MTVTVLNWSYYNVTYLWRLIRRQTVHSVHIDGNACLNRAPNPAQTVHGFFKPCTDGSFPLIVVKNTRQVVRIKVMRADLLGWRDVYGDFFFDLFDLVMGI